MKKNILLSSLFFDVLFFGVNSVQAAPMPHGGPHNGPQMHRQPVQHGHIHQAPRAHHHHHVRHSGFISPCYCPRCYPLGYYGTSMYYPAHYHGRWGASFHITL